jgi:hypothetical protein
MNCIIIAPHPDDELIGTFEILNDSKNKVTIIYDGDTEASRRNEAKKLRDVFPNVQNQVYHSSLPTSYVSKDVTIYAPDPVNEIHPLHRAWGTMCEQIARVGFDVVFYSTIMNVPYIHEVKDSVLKEAMLDRVYPSQKDMWAVEKKYVLFEGRCKWVF